MRDILKIQEEELIEPFCKDEVVFDDLAEIQIKDGLFSCALVRKREGHPTIVVQRIVLTEASLLHCANKAIRAVTRRFIGIN